MSHFRASAWLWFAFIRYEQTCDAIEHTHEFIDSITEPRKW